MVGRIRPGEVPGGARCAPGDEGDPQGATPRERGEAAAEGRGHQRPAGAGPKRARDGREGEGGRTGLPLALRPQPGAGRKREGTGQGDPAGRHASGRHVCHMGMLARGGLQPSGPMSAGNAVRGLRGGCEPLRRGPGPRCYARSTGRVGRVGAEPSGRRAAAVLAAVYADGHRRGSGGVNRGLTGRLRAEGSGDAAQEWGR